MRRRDLSRRGRTQGIRLPLPRLPEAILKRVRHFSAYGCEGKSRPGKVTIKAGTLDDTSALVLTGHVWTSRKQPWLDLDPDLPAWETQPTSPEEWELLWSGKGEE